MVSALVETKALLLTIVELASERTFHEEWNYAPCDTLRTGLSQYSFGLHVWLASSGSKASFPGASSPLRLGPSSPTLRSSPSHGCSRRLRIAPSNVVLQRGLRMSPCEVSLASLPVCFLTTEMTTGWRRLSQSPFPDHPWQ